jgi:hypothetical protein
MILNWTIRVDLNNSFKIPYVSPFLVIIIAHTTYMLDRASLNKCGIHCELRTLDIFIINWSICLNYRFVIKFKCSNRMELQLISCSCRSNIEVFNIITDIHQFPSIDLQKQIGFIQISLFNYNVN